MATTTHSSSEVPQLPYVETLINYTNAATLAEKPYTRLYEDPSKPTRNHAPVPHLTRVYNARPLLEKKKPSDSAGHLAGEVDAGLSLDVQGFELLEQRTKVEDFFDDDVVQRVYYDEVIELVKQATGAEDVIVFDHTVRAPKAKGRREPVLIAHNDYTLKSGPQRVRDLTPDEDLLRKRLGNRFAFINVWRPIHKEGVKVEEKPLAVCDARSTIPSEDFIAQDLIYRDRVGETYLVKQREGQRFYYFPGMHRGETILLKVFDSVDDGHTARFVAHTAFEDPTSPVNPLPRESIEVRTIAFFGDNARTQ